MDCHEAKPLRSMIVQPETTRFFMTASGFVSVLLRPPKFRATRFQLATANTVGYSDLPGMTKSFFTRDTNKISNIDFASLNRTRNMLRSKTIRAVGCHIANWNSPKKFDSESVLSWDRFLVSQSSKTDSPILDTDLANATVLHAFCNLQSIALLLPIRLETGTTR